MRRPEGQPGPRKTAPDRAASPCYAVIFTSVRTAEDDGYEAMAERMIELASTQPGFLGVDSVRDGRAGITVCYWTCLEAIAAWKEQAEHRAAQDRGQRDWYDAYTVRVAKVERVYRFRRGGA